jgi:hypothetical protein
VHTSTSSCDLILFGIWDQWKKHVISCKIWNFHSFVGERSVWGMMLCWLVFSCWCQGSLLPLKCHLPDKCSIIPQNNLYLKFVPSRRNCN